MAKRTPAARSKPASRKHAAEAEEEAHQLNGHASEEQDTMPVVKGERA